MKENLFEMLLSLFEKSLAQLKKKHEAAGEDIDVLDASDIDEMDPQENVIFIREASELSTRVITHEERIKMTKASYQFLTRLKLWGIVNCHLFEVILNQLQFSESRIVNLQETKWTVRNTLADGLKPEQLAFLDLVLYQKEDELALH